MPLQYKPHDGGWRALWKSRREVLADLRDATVTDWLKMGAMAVIYAAAPAALIWYLWHVFSTS